MIKKYNLKRWRIKGDFKMIEIISVSNFGTIYNNMIFTRTEFDDILKALALSKYEHTIFYRKK